MIYLKVLFGIVSVICIAFAIFNIKDFVGFCKKIFFIIFNWLRSFVSK